MRSYLIVSIGILLFITNSLLFATGADVFVTISRYPVFFSDGMLGLEPEEKEGYLGYLRDYNASEGLYSISCDENIGWIKRVGKIDIFMDEAECSGVSYGIISFTGHYLIGGIEGLKEGKIDIITPEMEIFPDSYEFEFAGHRYELFASGLYSGEEYDQAKEIQIKFKDVDRGIIQLLTMIPELESAVPSVLFIGDIDGDGKPDLILQEGYNYELSEKVLYLSSIANEGELVKRAGKCGMWHDC